MNGTQEEDVNTIQASGKARGGFFKTGLPHMQIWPATMEKTESREAIHGHLYLITTKL